MPHGLSLKDRWDLADVKSDHHSADGDFDSMAKPSQLVYHRPHLKILKTHLGWALRQLDENGQATQGLAIRGS
jgi:hypothetical protein